VGEWCDTWLKGYATRRKSTVRQARTHIAQIKAEFKSTPLSGVRPSQIRSWTGRLHEEGLADSYVYALHARLSQIMADAVRDGMIGQNPCSRWTSPGTGKQRPYVATTEQVWALYVAMPARYRAAVLLGAFVGLRVAEACGLRVADVDFMRGIVDPQVQYPAEPLKTETSRTSVPIPRALATDYLAPHVQQWRAETVLTNNAGGQLEPWRLERAFRVARSQRVHARGRRRRSECSGGTEPEHRRGALMPSQVSAPQPVTRRSTARTRAGADGDGSGPARSRACRRSTSR
jgi:integrase